MGTELVNSDMLLRLLDFLFLRLLDFLFLSCFTCVTTCCPRVHQSYSSHVIGPAAQRHPGDLQVEIMSSIYSLTFSLLKKHQSEPCMCVFIYKTSPDRAGSQSLSLAPIIPRIKCTQLSIAEKALSALAPAYIRSHPLLFPSSLSLHL